MSKIAVPVVNAMLETGLTGSLYVGLASDAPTIEAPTEIAAVPRQAISYAAATAGTKSNSSQHFFMAPTAMDVGGFLVWDAPTAGNVSWCGAMQRGTINIGANDVVKLDPGALMHRITS